MPFDVHITFAGLCLFVDRGGENPMEVLLPSTGMHATSVEDRGDGPGHAHPDAAEPADRGGESGTTASEHAHPEHVAVVLYATKNEEGTPLDQVSVLKRLDLKGGQLDLSQLSTKDRHLHVYLRDIVDLTEVVKGRRADRGSATARVLIGSGTACPISHGDHVRGGRWKLGNRPPQHMSTKVQWIIPDVVEIAGASGEEGLSLRIREADGTIRQPAPVLRPVNRRIDLLVYHTLEKDLPRADGTLPNPNETFESGEPAKHFEAFYRLFPGVQPVIPTFVDLGTGKDAEQVKALASGGAGLLVGCIGTMVREP